MLRNTYKNKTFVKASFTESEKEQGMSFHKGVCVVEGGEGEDFFFAHLPYSYINLLHFFRIKLRDQHNRDLDQVKESYEIKRRENEQV